MERFAVIGLGRFGARLATLLTEADAEVIAVDIRKDRVEPLRDRVTLAVCLDSVDEEALRAQGIDKVSVAIVGIGTDFESAVLATSLLKAMGIPRVVARATTTMRAKILSLVGADEVVNPEKEAAERWRDRLMAPSIKDRIELAEGYTLTQIASPPSFAGKTLEELDLRRKHKVNIVAIRRTEKETDAQGRPRTRQYVISVPMGDTALREGDLLLLIGSNEAMEDFPAK